MRGVERSVPPDLAIHSDQSRVPYHLLACDVRSESLTLGAVTPEPVTIALPGSGLLGIGAARLRRRTKDGTIEP